jgi:long-chain acyl-CoA synthetase
MMPMNWRLSAGELAAIVADGSPKTVLVGPDQRALLSEIADSLDSIVLGADYSRWRDAAPASDPDAPIGADDPALLLYTSGTTGQPKGVALSHGNLSFVERTAREIWAFTAASVNLVAMPLFHIGGIGYGMMALSQGGGTVLLQQPDPPATISAMRRHGVTHAFFVPTVIQRLVDHVERSGEAPSSLQRIVYGAAPIGEALLRRAISVFGCGFSHAYGMTETAGTVISLAPGDHDPDGPHAGRLRSCGRPLPWVELSLVDPVTGAPTPTGEVGEIRIQSPMNMLGYWGKPAETSAAITPDGWLCTGDAAYRDADGFVYIHDRYKDLIVSGGENIYPAEIERVLLTHPRVAEVAVIGVPHAVWGETPRAYVVRRGDDQPSPAELIEFVRKRLAHYKCPTSVAFVPALPRNPSGKVLKRELRKLESKP